VEDPGGDVLLTAGQGAKCLVQVSVHDLLGATEAAKRVGPQCVRVSRDLLLPQPGQHELQVGSLDAWVACQRIGVLLDRPASRGPEDHLADLDLVEDQLDELGFGGERLLGGDQPAVLLQGSLDRGAPRGGVQVPRAEVVVEQVGSRPLNRSSLAKASSRMATRKLTRRSARLAARANSSAKPPSP
jgi:hypothetical protein